MTFLDYTYQHASFRTYRTIYRYGIKETTPHHSIIQCGGIGQRSAQDIEKLQDDYIHTLDVATQIVIQYIRQVKASA